MLDSKSILVTMSSKSRCFVFQMMCKNEDEAECFWSHIVTKYPDDNWTWIYNSMNELSEIPKYDPIKYPA